MHELLLFLQQTVDGSYPVYMEIPSRLDNQDLYPLTSSHVSEVDSIASVTVEIPNDCCSSDGWAVAVFVALEKIDEGFLARENQLDNTKPGLGEHHFFGSEIPSTLILLLV